MLWSGGRALVVAMVAAAVLAAPAGAAFPGLNGKIAFERGFGPSIYTMEPDGSLQTLVRSGADNPVWSPDGSRIAFFDGTGNSDIMVMDPDGGNATVVCSCVDDFYGTGTIGSFLTWSPDGTKFAFDDGPSPSTRQIHRVNGDGTGETQLTSVGTNRGPAWSPDGTKIAFTSDRFPAGVWVMNADGTGQVGLGTGGYFGARPAWSPDGTRIAFERGRVIVVMNADGTDQTEVTVNTTGFDSEPEWSPDGQSIVYHDDDAVGPEGLAIINPDGTNSTLITDNLDRRPDWQPSPPSYPRPKGATPLSVSLVPAYAACTAPDRQHGPPLAFASCGPPVPSSGHLTVGSPDANGQPAKASGSVRMTTIVGIPQTQTDEADVSLQLQMTDVRRAGDLDDYTGEVQVRTTLRLTDKLNSPFVSAPGTVIDMPFTFTAGCSATADATVGGTCSITTSADALAFGTVHESRRSIWQLGQIQVLDGGADGVASTSGNALFAVSGVFVP